MSISQPVSFDRIAGRYDATRNLPREQQDLIARGILAAVGGRMGTRFVEPGIGTGRIALPLLRQGVTYAGTDISAAMLEEMRQKLRQEPWLAGQATVRQSDAAQLPFEDDSFDVALTAHLLHLVPDWRRVIDEIARVLRPGGCYVHATDDIGEAHAAFGQAWRQFAQARGLAGRPHTPVAESEILSHLRLEPAAMVQLTLARWPNPAKVGEILQSYRQRESSQLWHLSDGDHAALMGELEAWAAATYGKEDRILPSEACFNIAVIRLPA